MQGSKTSPTKCAPSGGTRESTARSRRGRPETVRSPTTWARTNESHAASSEESLGAKQQHRDQGEESDRRRERDAANKELAHVDDHAQIKPANKAPQHFPRPPETPIDQA